MSLGRMARGVTEQREASFASPMAPPKLFLADSGVSVGVGSPVPIVEADIMSPTSTLQAAVISPTSPAATAAPFSRHGVMSSSSSSGGDRRCKGRKSRSRHRHAWEARPGGLGLAGALTGDAVPPAVTVLTGQSFRQGRWWLMSPGEMEASEDYTRVIARGGPNPRTTHIFDDRVVVDGCGFSRSVGVGGEDDEFLRWCHGCSKDLGPGKDIFMYRGEMAFCSHECRYREMLLFDEES